jgi:hypothetical protein
MANLFSLFFIYWFRKIGRRSARSVDVEKAFLSAMQQTPEGLKIQARLMKCAGRHSNNDDKESKEEIYYERLETSPVI